VPSEAAIEIALAMSRKKQILSAAASSCVSGGDRRVLTWPARGAFVMIASAQASVRRVLSIFFKKQTYF
jgi:hypothetical protein